MKTALDIAEDARGEAARLMEQAATLLELANTLDPPRVKRKYTRRAKPENARARHADRIDRRETRLRVLSSTKPTPVELEGREVVHVTEQPA